MNDEEKKRREYMTNGLQEEPRKRKRIKRKKRTQSKKKRKRNRDG